MIILSVDLGKSRTGTAVCDNSEIIASPLEVIKEHNKEKLIVKITELCVQREVQLIVLGLPKNMDGTEGESAINAREFGKMLAEHSKLPVEFVDERGTTITAHNFLNTTNTRGKNRKQVVDAVAATIILEDFLRFRRNKNG